MSTNKTAKNDKRCESEFAQNKERTCRNGDSLSRHRRNFASGTLADIVSPLQSYIDDRSHPRSTSIDTSSREENHLNIRCEVRDERRVGVSTNKRRAKKRCEFAQKEGSYRNTHLNAVLIFLSTLFLYYAIRAA